MDRLSNLPNEVLAMVVAGLVEPDRNRTLRNLASFRLTSQHLYEVSLPEFARLYFTDLFANVDHLSLDILICYARNEQVAKYVERLHLSAWQPVDGTSQDVIQRVAIARPIYERMHNYQSQRQLQRQQETLLESGEARKILSDVLRKLTACHTITINGNDVKSAVLNMGGLYTHKGRYSWPSPELLDCAEVEKRRVIVEVSASNAMIRSLASTTLQAITDSGNCLTRTLYVGHGGGAPYSGHQRSRVVGSVVQMHALPTTLNLRDSYWLISNLDLEVPACLALKRIPDCAEHLAAFISGFLSLHTVKLRFRNWWRQCPIADLLVDGPNFSWPPSVLLGQLICSGEDLGKLVKSKGLRNVTSLFLEEVCLQGDSEAWNTVIQSLGNRGGSPVYLLINHCTSDYEGRTRIAGFFHHGRWSEGLNLHMATDGSRLFQLPRAHLI